MRAAVYEQFGQPLTVQNALATKAAPGPLSCAGPKTRYSALHG